MGFAVLLGLIAYFFLARAVARAVEKKAGSKKAKYITIAIFVLIPTWDIIPGWLYFEYLCQTEGGQKIYKTVELPQEYFLKAGEFDPSRPDPVNPTQVARATGGEINRKKLFERYANPDRREKYYSPLFHIDKDYSFVQDKQSGEILGSATSFGYFGGWLSDFLTDHTSPTICPKHQFNPYVPSIHSTLVEKIFRPIMSS